MGVARKMAPTANIDVSFEHDLHKALHDVLVANGFDFRVSADGKVGRDYWSDRKNLHVYLKDIDAEDETETEPEMDAFLDRDGTIFTHQDYSEAEWNWMNAKSKKTTPGSDEVEFLTRELHIQCNVRPNYMTAAQMKRMS